VLSVPLSGYRGIYDYQGNAILKPEFSNIEITSNYFYTKKQGNDNYNQKDVYTRQGENITKGKWHIDSHYSKDDILLVYTQERQDNTFGKRSYAYIDNQGKVIIDASNYSNVKPFSNRLAQVKINSENKWGYINTKGQMVIDAQYERSMPFIKNTAMVKSGNRYLFIDKNNKVITTVNSSLTSSSYSVDGDTATYSFENGEHYDQDGKLIKEPNE